MQITSRQEPRFYEANIKELNYQLIENLSMPGGMIDKFIIPNYKDLTGRIFYAFSGNQCVGWCFAVIIDRFPDSSYVHFGVYVHYKMRKLGIGRELYRRAKALYPDMKVERHDFISEKFFDKMGA